MVKKQANRRYLPALDALRAIAAIGIISTHVAFQTDITDPFLGAIAARMDYWVAVFFALSGYLLWGAKPSRRYYKHRFARLAPAYLVYVIIVLLFVPAARTNSPSIIIANLLMLQIYVPGALIGGLTHLWSLCVEVAFYLVLPLLYSLSRRIPGGTKTIIVVLAAISLAWPWVPEFLPINQQTLPFSYGIWFALGIAAHEYRPTHKISKTRFGLCVLLAILMAWVAGQSWYGPLGLNHPNSWQFNLRILGGLIFAASVFLPTLNVALTTDTPGRIQSWLIWAGQRGYSIFLWHLAILSFIFPLTGISLFSRSLLDSTLVLILTTAATLVVANLSYEFVELPARQWLLARSTKPQNSSAQQPHTEPKATVPAQENQSPQDQ
ncbi:MAG: acyltransferase [Corynebacterium sp.]|nr:acyltransferase [Corynebacterium sp.]